jgi:DNA-binding MarR family transcriptional regulator
MKVHRPETIETLRLVAGVDHITTREIAKELRLTVDIAKRRIDNLHMQGFVESHGYVRGLPVKYSVTPKGLSMLRSIDAKPEPGDFPTPRIPISKEPYVPPQWNIRQGGRDHEAIRSRGFA